jgi:hypothetical protein
VTVLLDKRQGYLASKAPFILDPLLGLSLLLFCLKPQELLLLLSFFIIAVQDIFDLSRSRSALSTYDRRSTWIELLKQKSHLVATTGLLLDLVFFPFFPVDLSPHLGLALTVSSGSALLIIVDGIVQGVLELIETRKDGHDRIEMDIAKRSNWL